MTAFGPKSIRGKVTLLATVATAVAMVLIVAAMGIGMRAILENAIADSLRERLDQACLAVEAGDYAAAADASGNEMIQVIDAAGNVVAESRNARGLAALADRDDDDESEVPDLEFERVEPGKDASSAASDGTASGDAPEAGEAPATVDVPVPSGEDGGNALGANADADADADDADGDNDDDEDDARHDAAGGADSSGNAGDGESADDDADDSDDSDDADDSDDSDDADGADDSDDDDDDADETAGERAGSLQSRAAADDEGDDDDKSASVGGGGNGNADDSDDDGDDEGDEDDARGADRDDEDDEDDDDGDDDDEKRVKNSAALGGQMRLPDPSPSSLQSPLPLPFSPGKAWAASPTGAEDPTDPANPAERGEFGEPTGVSGAAETVDAQAILGTEGPYLILKAQATGPDGPMTLVAVTSLASAARSATQMAWLLAVIMAAVLVAVVAFAWALTGRTLRPVEDMRAQAASISADNLGERIDVPSSDKDLARLAETLNGMLARVERSLEDEKRFISDASHELKSPVAATSVILESLRAYPDQLDADRAIGDLMGENARIAAIVGDMLALTRYDEGRLNFNPEPIDLMDLVFEEASTLKARASVEVDTADVRPVTCRADADLLAHALRNLLDNAARYAESRVKVSCEQDDSGAVLIRVSDDGPGIAPEDRERAFGRFVCLDERSGTGLGLAVAQSAVAAHGGTLEFTDPELSGATALITLRC